MDEKELDRRLRNSIMTDPIVNAYWTQYKRGVISQDDFFIGTIINLSEAKDELSRMLMDVISQTPSSPLG